MSLAAVAPLLLALAGFEGNPGAELERLRQGVLADSEKRVFFAGDLLASQDPRAAETVRALLRDGSAPEEAVEALLRAVAYRKDRRFIKDVLPHVTDEKRPKARAAALDALRGLRDEQGVFAELLLFLNGNGGGGVEARLAIQAFGELRDVRAVPELVGLLVKAADAETKTLIVRSLERITRVEHIGIDPARWFEWSRRVYRKGMTREELLDAALVEIRNDAIAAHREVLKEKGVEELVTRLRRAIYPEVRQHAAELLRQRTRASEIGRVVGPLTDALADPWDAVAGAAAVSLGALAELMRRELPEPAAELTQAIQAAAARMEWLLARPGEALRASVVAGLVGIRDPGVQERLRGLLHTLFEERRDPALRALLVKGLGDLKDAAALPLLTEVLRKDGHPPARLEAATALAKIPGAAATEALMAAFREERDPDLRVRVAFALADREDRAAVPALLDGLKDPDSGVRQVCVTGLGRSGDPRAGEPLKVLLEGRPEEPVLGACIEALGRLRHAPAASILLGYLEQKPQAERAVKALREIAATDADTALLVAAGLAKAGRSRDAADIYREVLRSPPAGLAAERLLQVRMGFLRALSQVEGDAAAREMDDLGDALIREDPGREFAVRRIQVGSYVRERAWRRAEIHLRYLVDAFPEERQLRVWLADCQQAQGRPAEAAKRYRAILEGLADDGPEQWDVKLRLADALLAARGQEALREAHALLGTFSPRFEEAALPDLKARLAGLRRQAEERISSTTPRSGGS